MDSRLHGVPLSATPPVAPKTVPSGIRAPITVDESDFEYSSRRNSITSSYGGDESEGFVSGGEDDYESASETPNLSVQDEGVLEGTQFINEYAFSRPSMVRPNGVLGQQSSNRDAYTFYKKNLDEAFARGSDNGSAIVRPLVGDSDKRVIKVGGIVDDSDDSRSFLSESGDEVVEDNKHNGLSNGGSAPPLAATDEEVSESEPMRIGNAEVPPPVEILQIPIAKISADSDYDSENSVVLEDGGFSGVVPSIEDLHRINSPPKARLSGEGDGHDIQADNVVDVEFVKEMVTNDHDLGSKEEREGFGVDETSIDHVISSDVISDKELEANSMIICEENSSIFEEEHNETQMNLDEEIREIDVINDVRKCADFIYQREPTNLSGNSSAASSGLPIMVEPVEPEVTELGCSSSNFGSPSVDEDHSFKFEVEQNEHLKNLNEEIQDIDVIGSPREFVDLIDQREPPKITELRCISAFCAPSPDDGDQKGSNTILEDDVTFSQDMSSDEQENDREQDAGFMNCCADIKILSEEEKQQLEKIQQIRINYLRILHRLGYSPDDPVASDVIYQLTFAERVSSHMFNLDSATKAAMELEAHKKDDMDFSMCILVIGKTGAGKSSTINSIFGEKKAAINAFEPTTIRVQEIIGIKDGVKLKVIDTPGLRSSLKDQSTNQKVLLSIKRLMQKSPPDVILYVDRLDTQATDLNDLPVLKLVTSCLGSSIWQKCVLVLTHATSMPPDGPSGYPLSYEACVAQRSLYVQQLISHAVGEHPVTNAGYMIPLSLVENNPIPEKNGHGETLPHHGRSRNSPLLLLCHSMKILSEVSSAVTIQNPLGIKKINCSGIDWPSPSYLSPELSSDQSGEIVNSDGVLGYSSCSDQHEASECDNLPPFKPLKKSRDAKLIGDKRPTDFQVYHYLVRLLQKTQLRGEKRRFWHAKKVGHGAGNQAYFEEIVGEEVLLQDMTSLSSFCKENPSIRYHFPEPSFQLLTQPILCFKGWKHDCDCEGDMGSTVDGSDLETSGKNLASILKGRTKVGNLKKTAKAEVSITFLNENEVLGLKVEDQIAVGNGLMLTGNTGVAASQDDAAYGANVELCRTDKDHSISHHQTSMELSILKYRGDLVCGCNLQSQFSVGKSSKVIIGAGLNNKLKGQISIKISCSDQLQIAAVALIPVARAIFEKVFLRSSKRSSE